MAKVVDCVERMIQFKQRCPDAEFDLKPNMFTARVPGHDEPFRALSLCSLMNTVERWAAEEMMARLLFGPSQPGARAPPARRKTDDRLPESGLLLRRRYRTGIPAAQMPRQFCLRRRS